MVSRIGDGPATQPSQSSFESGSVDNNRIVTSIQPISPPAQQATQEKQAELSQSETKELTESMNKFLDSANVQLRFRFH